jgi:uncharacterized protein (DUF2249 family)
MKANGTDAELDVRPLPPCERHITIFQTWAQLQPGASFLLVNDHDPLPLYYQFAAEEPGRFHWQYEERGPEAWRVRIRKGEFPTPGFTPPTRKTAPAHAVQSHSTGAPPKLLDTRPIFARGATPCEEIDAAAAGLLPGQSLILLVPFEPVPLYHKLGREGFQHETTQLEDGTWQTEFWKAPAD